MSAVVPTADELTLLSSASIPAPGDTVPDPEPQIIARAQELVDRIKSGESLSGESNTPDTVVVSEPMRDLTADQKIRFMAHVMAGKPYEESYTAFGLLAVEFRTLSPVEEEFLSELVYADEVEGIVAKGRRRVQYNKYALAMSLTRLTWPDGDSVVQKVFPTTATLATARKAHASWYGELTGGYYRVIDTFYRQFTSALDLLYARVDSPDFWPTPSSP